MRVFITGGAGWVGSEVIRQLVKGGHDVTALVRSVPGVEKVTNSGARALEGNLTDTGILRAAAEEADAVIHCAFNHAFSGLDMMGMIAVRLSGIAGFARISPAARLDLNAIEALLDGIAASTSPTKALVSTSGIACIAPGRVGTEDLPASPRASAAWRVASERLALSGPSSGVRTAVVRLPPSVHGVGDKGFVRMYVDLARKKGVSAWVGAGEGRWSAVHRDDAAALYCLAVEGLANGAVPGGTVLHGVADEGIPFRDIATTIGERLGLGQASPAPRGHFPMFLRLVAAQDVPATSDITRKLTGWRPTRPGLLDDVRSGAYGSLAASPSDGGAGVPRSSVANSL